MPIKAENGGSPPEIDLSKINIPVDLSTMVGPELTINEALPGLVRGEPTALLLDVNNLFRVARKNDFRIDYVRLKSIFENRCDLRYCSAFSAVDRDDTGAVNWANYLADKGYTLVTKDLKRWYNDTGQLISKGNMDIEIAVAAMSLSPAFSHIVIGTCDGDFIPLIEKLREGSFRKVSVLGLRNKDWSGMSKSLVKSADNFYDLLDIKDYVSYKNSKND